MAQQYRRQRQEESENNQIQTFWPMLDYNQHVMMALQACIIVPPIPGAFRVAVQRLEALVLDEWKDEKYTEDMLPIVVRGYLNSQRLLIYADEPEYNEYPLVEIYPARVLHAISQLMHRRGVFDTSDSVSLIP